MDKSRKTATRVRLKPSKHPITDTTKIENTPPRDLLSHTCTKDLTVYLAAHVIEQGRETEKAYVVASRHCKCIGH